MKLGMLMVLAPDLGEARRFYQLAHRRVLDESD
jgi:hypothetical protein